MKVLVIGSGGREHALVWKLWQSPRVAKIYCAPGNGGIADEAECVAVDVKSLDSMIALANQIHPDLTIVGPELPLMLGLVDEFTRRGWRTFGPTRAAARLETSKSFAKEFLQRHRIPTAHYAICDSSEHVRDALPHFHAPIVVKADGLAAGKGVVIAKSKDEASTVANEMLSGRMLGEAGIACRTEEFLQGATLVSRRDGERVAPLVAAQDHKRVGDGDTGPNTGGMGAYTTRTIVDDQMRDWLVAHIARPVVTGMKAEGAEYKGVLYCGLMMTARGPIVLEFNCRFGDPETQPILMRLESDLVEAMEASIDGRTSDGDFKWSNDAAVCVVMASGGYPGSYAGGENYRPEMPRSWAAYFHAGTSKRDSASILRRPRSGNGSAAERNAVQRAYQACAKIGFEGAQYRETLLRGR
jgi:phosphoribosylamine--glycine ligase